MKLAESKARLAGKTREALMQKVVDEATTIKVYNVAGVGSDSILGIVGHALGRASGNMEKPINLAMPTLGLVIAVRRKNNRNIDVVIFKRTKGEE